METLKPCEDTNNTDSLKCRDCQKCLYDNLSGGTNEVITITKAEEKEIIAAAQL